jgi:hypothetical protein
MLDAHHRSHAQPSSSQGQFLYWWSEEENHDNLLWVVVLWDVIVLHKVISMCCLEARQVLQKFIHATSDS